MLLLQIIGGLCLRVPGAWFFGVYLGGGLVGCWCGMWLDNLAKFVGGWLRFESGGWKRLRV
jgi:Na+-driven multidrug efflux pump